MHPRTHVRLIGAAARLLVGHPSVRDDASPVHSRSGASDTVVDTDGGLLSAIRGAHLLGRLEAVTDTGVERRLEAWTESRRDAGLAPLRGTERDDAFLADMVAADPVTVETKFAVEAICLASRTVAREAHAKSVAEARFQDRPVTLSFDECERAACIEGARAIGMVEMRAGEALTMVYARAMKRTHGSLDAARSALSRQDDFRAFASLIAHVGMAFGQLDPMKGTLPVNLEGVEVPLVAYGGEGWVREIEDAFAPSAGPSTSFGVSP